MICMYVVLHTVTKVLEETTLSSRTLLLSLSKVFGTVWAKIRKKCDLEKPQIIKPRFFDFFIAHFFFFSLLFSLQGALYMIISFSYQVKLKVIYVPCSKVPEVALLYIPPSKFYQITKNETKVIERKRENFCLLT